LKWLNVVSVQFFDGETHPNPKDSQVCACPANNRNVDAVEKDYQRKDVRRE
jgi:hypothetical protein